jgi:hypothetical protein
VPHNFAFACDFFLYSVGQPAVRMTSPPAWQTTAFSGGEQMDRSGRKGPLQGACMNRERPGNSWTPSAATR